MGHQQDTAADSRPSNWYDDSSSPHGELELSRLNGARAQTVDEAAAVMARELNGPLTALLLYMGEIKHHSDQLVSASGDRAYIQRVVENALTQTERVCALVKQFVGPQRNDLAAVSVTAETDAKSGRVSPGPRPVGVELSKLSGQKRLTKREREVLRLISEGYSNKQGALRMQISPRTFESHRAEAMRKLGARNTADLVRAALLHLID
ncbi:helix-turn-helix transcriptional regulator [Bradyrhizobium manausense]|uniref:helix-turn-helix domain-containing protein n=1 Tax=Bradyrhizobium TaxID=374 RepID=UPI001BA47BC4|nr:MULTISPECIES: helix-turn-helix transcriptional regulator [Bradyrhizobium]MBR0824603.1 helix-turn-helix transcriptional regulator [Bradyrhizobium manausense]UVO29608.1 helix-turn-helix transcriptional regulator [Bradyrhizobium arachidis]